MKLTNIKLLSLIIFYVFISCGKETPAENDDYIGPPSDHPWPMFQHDPQHTGRSKYNGPELTTLKWKVNIGAGYSAPVIDKEGTLFLGSKTGGFYAVKSEGTIKWYFSTSQAVTSSPALDKEGNIYFVCEDKYIYSLTPDGALRWKYLTTKKMGRINPIIGDDGTIYIVSDKGYAFNPDGSIKWTRSMGADLLFDTPSTPVIDNEGYIIMGLDNDFISIITPEGKIRMRLWKGYISISSPAIFGSSNLIAVLIAGPRCYFSMMHTDGGNMMNLGTSSTITASPATYGKTVYMPLYRHLVAFQTGNWIIWEWNPFDIDPDIILDNSPVIDGDRNNHKIYIGGGEYVFLLSRYGELIKSFFIGDKVISSPVLSYDRLLYITGESGYLYAIE